MCSAAHLGEYIVDPLALSGHLHLLLRPGGGTVLKELALSGGELLRKLALPLQLGLLPDCHRHIFKTGLGESRWCKAQHLGQKYICVCMNDILFNLTCIIDSPRLAGR
jgi:hypothetical protein